MLKTVPFNNSDKESFSFANEPVVGNVTRIVLVVSEAFQPPTIKTVVVFSDNVGDAGCTVSKTNEGNKPAELTFPATSLILADNTFSPSLPSSVFSNVKST